MPGPIPGTDFTIDNIKLQFFAIKSSNLSLKFLYFKRGKGHWVSEPKRSFNSISKVLLNKTRTFGRQLSQCNHFPSRSFDTRIYPFLSRVPFSETRTYSFSLLCSFSIYLTLIETLKVFFLFNFIHFVTHWMPQCISCDVRSSCQDFINSSQ